MKVWHICCYNKNVRAADCATCGPHGTCLSDGSCHCATGYTGATCNEGWLDIICWQCKLKLYIHVLHEDVIFKCSLITSVYTLPHIIISYNNSSSKAQHFLCQLM